MPQPTSFVAIMDIKPKQMFTMYEKLRVVRNPFNPENPYIHFPDNTHFARLVIIPGEHEDDIIYPGEHQDRGGVEDKMHRILLWAIFDGDETDYFRKVVELSPNLDDLFGHLEGYTHKEHLLPYLQKHRKKEQVFYATFPEDSVKTIREKRDLRNRLEKIADSGVSREELITQAAQMNPVVVLRTRRTEGLRTLLLIVLGAALFIAVMAWLWISLGLWWLVLIIVALLAVLPISVILQLRESRQPFKGQTGAVADQIHEYFDMQKISGINYVDPMRGRSREHTLAQNQFNLYLTFKDSGLRRWWRVMSMRLLMIYLNLAGRYILPPGKLGGLSTAHFGAWVLIDNNRRLFFMTCYDGTWENYIADFVNRIYTMLDVELWNFIGFSDAGTRDIASFRRWLRRVQIQSEVFYSGYPTLTVRNIARDERLNENLPQSENEDASAFLAEL